MMVGFAVTGMLSVPSKCNSSPTVTPVNVTLPSPLLVEQVVVTVTVPQGVVLAFWLALLLGSADHRTYRVLPADRPVSNWLMLPPLKVVHVVPLVE